MEVLNVQSTWYPMRLSSIYREKIWGGTQIPRLRGEFSDRCIGESWDIACRSDSDNRVANGRFAGELFRTLALQGVELLLLPAQWPAARRYHWETLTAARAIENQFFLAACNSCGTAGETVFGGASRILGPRGELLAAAGAGEEIVTAALDFSVLAEVRNSINVFHDRRPELYRL